jgi:hypothetical protein
MRIAVIQNEGFVKAEMTTEDLLEHLIVAMPNHGH